MDPLDLLVWVDLETTGLDEFDDIVIEAGVIATDGQLNIISVGPDFIIQPDEEMPPMVDVVVEMHTTNGLLAAIEQGQGISLVEAEQGLLAWVQQWGIEPGTVPMCGSSVHFDRKMLARHMPLFHDWFFRRNIDVSSWKEGIKRFLPEDYARSEDELKPRKTHSSIDDLLDTIEEFRFYKNLLAPRTGSCKGCGEPTSLTRGNPPLCGRCHSTVWV